MENQLTSELSTKPTFPTKSRLGLGVMSHRGKFGRIYHWLVTPLVTSLVGELQCFVLAAFCTKNINFESFFHYLIDEQQGHGNFITVLFSIGDKIWIVLKHFDQKRLRKLNRGLSMGLAELQVGVRKEGGL